MGRPLPLWGTFLTSPPGGPVQFPLPLDPGAGEGEWLCSLRYHLKGTDKTGQQRDLPQIAQKEHYALPLVGLKHF